MNATNRLAPSAPKQTFSNAVTSNSMQTLIQKSLKDKNTVARFTSTLISVVNASDQLKACEPGTIVAAALRGEGMGLILNVGYYLVPYGQICTYILGYKGLIQLALATGQYMDIDCMEVRDGEYLGRDSRTGKPAVDFNTYKTDEEREKAQIIGYYAYFQLKNGMFRSEYWSINKLLFHADRYSQAFDIEKYQAYVAGELSEAEEAKMRKSSPWNDVDGGQDKMFKKTVLRSLLNSGYAPLSNEVRYAMDADDDMGTIPEMPLVNLDKPVEAEGAAAPKPAIESSQDGASIGAIDLGNDVELRQKAKKETVKAEKETKPKMKTEVPSEDFTDDDGFFGDDMA